MTTGAELIAAERQRQIDVEGYTPEHDASHPWDMTEAAKCYLWSAQATQYGSNCVSFDGGYRPEQGTPRDWPWQASAWKPSGFPIPDLVRAGALIAAEIDRLQRAGEAARR